MKKAVALFVLLNFLLACNNSSTTTTSADSSNTNTTGVENVNGNVPDTTSGIQLNQSLPKDSSRVRDSSRQ